MGKIHRTQNERSEFILLILFICFINWKFYATQFFIAYFINIYIHRYVVTVVVLMLNLWTNQKFCNSSAPIQSLSIDYNSVHR